MSKSNNYIPYDKKDKSMENHNKKITTSKICLVTTGFIFVSITIVCLLSIIHSESIFDTTVFVTAITVSGGIFGSNLVWYSKKSASENHYKLRMSMYEDVVNQRLYFNEEMLKLRKKYNVSEDVMENINNYGEIDEMMDDALCNVKDKLDRDQDDIESPNELQNFNI